MPERNNLPVARGVQAIAVSTEQRSSLIGRGLAALKLDNAALYRQARAVFDRRDGIRNWGSADNPAIFSAFKIFQRLADEDYGKAYYPLSILFSGRNDIEDGETQARHYTQLAFEWCLFNQTNDDAELWCDLADMHNVAFGESYGVPQSKEMAEAWYRKSAEQGYARGQWEFGSHLHAERHTDCSAFYWMELAAHQGDAFYQVWLADYCDILSWEHLTEIEQYQKASYWYRMAAEQGDSWGQTNLGEMYREGLGVEQNDEQAVYWYRMAAEQGNADAQWRLAGMYEYGRGVIPNTEQAIYWYRKSAENDDERALRDLDGIYEQGRGGDLDESQAVFWNQKSAEEGHVWAMINLATMYENGLRVEQNDEQAFFWYRKAAEQGYPWTDADFGAARLFELGNIYRRGGEKEDIQKALEYYLVAAKLGHAEAQFCLSDLRRAQSKDTDSIYWLKCSSDLGFGPAQLAYAEFVREDEAQILIDAAADWYKAQAESGDKVWQYEYSLLLLRDDNEWCADPEEGLRWLKSSADQDYIPACRRLASEYLCGDVSEIATQQGIFWLSHAADLGDAMACESLGDLFLLGHHGGSYAASKGVLPTPRIHPDNSIAVNWYERGIATGTRRGNSLTAFKLGRHFLTGEHLDQDLQLAEKWLLHSAENGGGYAQNLLADEYFSGTRFRQVTDAATRWLELARKTILRRHRWRLE